jgi:F0F1-type ATP synthase membrane subunit c/vacuolar-type H+-ATPase subunit K
LFSFCVLFYLFFYFNKYIQQQQQKGWNEVLTHMSPYGWGYYGIGFGLGLSVVGAAWGIWLTGSCLVGAAVKSPRIRSKNLIRWEKKYVELMFVPRSENEM